MKKLLLLSVLLIPIKGFSQINPPQLNYPTNAQTTGAGVSLDIRGRALRYFKVTWEVQNGTASACTFNLQTSDDNVTFTTQGITFTCTSTGHSDVFTMSAQYIRINVATLTFSSAPTPVLVINTLGWIEADVGPTINGFPASTTLTNRNSVGVQVFEKSSRWTAVSAPAASSQATASIAAEAAVRHVADCVTFSGSAVAVPAATTLAINLRDGATGAGTVIASWTVTITATTGNLVAPFGLCGLNLVGSTNTAMTLEFSALLTSLVESVTLTGFNVN